MKYFFGCIIVQLPFESMKKNLRKTLLLFHLKLNWKLSVAICGEKGIVPKNQPKNSVNEKIRKLKVNWEKNHGFP